MMKHRALTPRIALASLAMLGSPLLTACVSAPADTANASVNAAKNNTATTASSSHAIAASAAFSTFDATLGGCLNSSNGVNCNNYVAKDRVYMSGGPNGPNSGLADGQYYFAVLTPGSQNGGFVDGASGNLSDTTAGGTTGDAGGGDDVSNRTFSVSGGQISAYAGTHATGQSPNGRSIIGLAPFDDTDNPGGVYILAICQVGATDPKQCKYDAFRVTSNSDGGGQTFAVVSGMKYYDANTNGQRDPDEVGIANWPVYYTDQVADTIYTGADGTFSLSMMADSYCFVESSASSPWRQTGNLVNQTAVTGGASATLRADQSYGVTVVDGSTVTGVFFGNICLGGGGGLTLGFWSNRNGGALVNASDLGTLVAMNLRNADGSNFDPASYSALRTWLLSGTATNMAYMLSVQLATMKLNVLHGFVSTSAYVAAPGAVGANVNGFITVGALLNEANAELGAHGLTPSGSPYRAYQEALKNALDNANNNRTFVQPSPDTCPAPVFAAATTCTP